MLLVGFNSFATGDHDHDHSETVCSKLDANVCAHLGHMTKLNSSDEVQFVSHVMTPANQPISDMKVDLWMPSMGHGSSPVKLASIGVNKYKVSEAFFIMTGEWQVRMTFTFNKVKHQINIPVTVEQ